MYEYVQKWDMKSQDQLHPYNQTPSGSGNCWAVVSQSYSNINVFHSKSNYFRQVWGKGNPPLLTADGGDSSLLSAERSVMWKVPSTSLLEAAWVSHSTCTPQKYACLCALKPGESLLVATFSAICLVGFKLLMAFKGKGILTGLGRCWQVPSPNIKLSLMVPLLCSVEPHSHKFSGFFRISFQAESFSQKSQSAYCTLIEGIEITITWSGFWKNQYDSYFPICSSHVIMPNYLIISFFEACLPFPLLLDVTLKILLWAKVNTYTGT